MGPVCTHEIARLFAIEKLWWFAERLRQAGSLELQPYLDEIERYCRRLCCSFAKTKMPTTLPEDTLAHHVTQARQQLDEYGDGLDPQAREHFEFRYRELFLVCDEVVATLSMGKSTETPSTVLVAAVGRRLQTATSNAMALCQDVESYVASL